MAAEVQIEFPRSFQSNAIARTAAKLAASCEGGDGLSPDFVLLLPESIPNDVTALHLATEDRFEFGDGYAFVGLVGRDKGKPDVPEDLPIEGRIAEIKNAKGVRIFTGSDTSGYWLERGTSGSPVFLHKGQQLAGIVAASELGANQGKSPLRTARVIPATMIRPYVIELVAQQVAEMRFLDLSTVRPVLDALDAHSVPIVEIGERLKQFVEAARTHAANPVRPSNEGSDIDVVIKTSREKLRSLDQAHARSTLQEKISKEKQNPAPRLVSLLKERAVVERLAYDYDASKATLAEIGRLAPDDVWVWIDLGDLWMATGSLYSAAEAYYRSADSAARRTRNEYNLAVTQERLGDVLCAQGDSAAALTAYRASLNIRDALKARDPADAAWLTGLSVGHDKIGDVLRAQGDSAAALAAYRSSLAIREKLADQAPSDTGLQRNISVCHDKIGDALRALGDRSAAIKAYRASFCIRSTLDEGDPFNTEWQRSLSISHHNIGDMLLLEGDRDGALAAYRASLTISEALARRHPINIEWQRARSIIQNRIDDVLVSNNRRAELRTGDQEHSSISATFPRRAPVATGIRSDFRDTDPNRFRFSSRVLLSALFADFFLSAIGLLFALLIPNILLLLSWQQPVSHFVSFLAVANSLAHVSDVLLTIIPIGLLYNFISFRQFYLITGQFPPPFILSSFLFPLALLNICLAIMFFFVVSNREQILAPEELYIVSSSVYAVIVCLFLIDAFMCICNLLNRSSTLAAVERAQ